MKKTLFAFLASLAIGAMSIQAQEAAPAEAAPAAPAIPAVPAVPALDLEPIYALIPENVVTAGETVLVTKKQIMEVLKPAVDAALAQGAPIQAANVTSFAYQVAQGLGIQAVMLDNARKAGVAGDAAAAKERLEQIKKAITEQVGENAFAEQLASLGLSEDDLLQKFIEEGMIQKYSESLNAAVAAKVADPTEEEIKKFYDENSEGMKEPASYSAAHILVQFPSQTPTDEEKAAALAKLNDIKGKLAADGSNFGDLAKEFSDCPSKAQGGDLGQFPAGAMVKEFEDALVAMKEGEISGPVETMFGYHLIKAGASSPERVVSLDEAKDQIKDYLKGMAMEVAAKNQLDEIIKASGMTINLAKPEMPVME